MLEMKVNKPAARWMALDLGSKTIGVAITDPLRISARPLTTIERINADEDAKRLLELTHSYQVERVLVGRPLHLDGRPSSNERRFLPLVEKLRLSVPIEWADERLSSKEAEALMAELGIPVSERRKKRDEVAAALILQWYLEEQQGGNK
jgi:putative Holliday junction resolvase